jgi:peptidoglycan-associated lipoprotein
MDAMRVFLIAASIAVLAVPLLGAEAPRARPSARPGAAKARQRVRPTPRPQPTPTPTPTPRPPDAEYDRLSEMRADEIDRLNLLAPVYFAEASAEIQDVDEPILEQNAAVLKKFDFLTITLEAHCDSRGDPEYNMRLGDGRVKAVLKRMVALGVPASRLRTVSFGKEVPSCRGDDEECLTKSRRVHFAVTGKQRE